MNYCNALAEAERMLMRGFTTVVPSAAASCCCVKTGLRIGMTRQQIVEARPRSYGWPETYES